VRRDVNGDGLRRDTIGDDVEIAPASLDLGRAWHGEVSGRDEVIFRSNSHRAVIKRPCIENMPGDRVDDPHERIIGGGLYIVPVSDALRKPI
jgi:hypothetical protein